MAGIDRTQDLGAEARAAAARTQAKLDRAMHPKPGPGYVSPSTGDQPFEYPFKPGPNGRPIPDVPGGK